jgi:UDP-galactopyranose mutase
VQWFVVGAGLSGCTCARLLADAGHEVVLVEREKTVGGLCRDEYDCNGLLRHCKGVHVFHADNPKVWQFLDRFTGWRSYEHRVMASVKNDHSRLIGVPVTRKGLIDLLGQEDAEKVLREHFYPRYGPDGSVPVVEMLKCEDAEVRRVGKVVFESIYRGYTRKQWGPFADALHPSVLSRVPVRMGVDDRCFVDIFQALPIRGYAALFEKMLDHHGIKMALGCDFHQERASLPETEIIYTGALDEYFDFKHGQLPYRSLRWEHETMPEVQHQPVAQVNYPDESVPYTRVLEWKHLTGQDSQVTAITTEFPKPCDGTHEAYYPVPTDDSLMLASLYAAEAEALREKRVFFTGRLATFQYINMDKAIENAMATVELALASAEKRA